MCFFKKEFFNVFLATFDSLKAQSDFTVLLGILWCYQDQHQNKGTVQFNDAERLFIS